MEIYSSPVYKWIKLKYVIQMLDTNKLRLNKVDSWEDVYENILAKQTVNNIERVHERCYLGQSWTLLEESDALWRIYSHQNKDNQTERGERVIRIKTNVSKMGQMCCRNGLSSKEFWIRKVRYKTSTSIEEWLKGLKRLSPDEYIQQQLDSLFIKRDSFAHEEEVRLLLCTNEDIPHIELDIDAVDLIEEFCIDPRADYEEMKEIKARLIEHGAWSNRIVKSDLYKYNQHVIEIV